MPTIRVDGAVYKALQERAEAFVDTPNSVLRRILGFQPGRDETEELEVGTSVPEGRGAAIAKQGGRRATGKTAAATPRRRRSPGRRERAPSGSLLPSERYREPILRALAQSGGTGSGSRSNRGGRPSSGRRLQLRSIETSSGLEACDGRTGCSSCVCAWSMRDSW